MFSQAKYMYVLIDPCIILNLVKLGEVHKHRLKNLINMRALKLSIFINFNFPYEFKTDFYKTLQDFLISVGLLGFQWGGSFLTVDGYFFPILTVDG